MNQEKKDVMEYMVRELEEYPKSYIDSITGEVNNTRLAIEAGCHFGNYEDDIPECYEDWATVIATRHEILTGAQEGKITHSLGFVINHPEDDFGGYRVY